MPIWRVIFSRLASKEFHRARDWYAEHSLEAATRFAEAVNKAVERIVAEPDALPSLSEKYRSVRVKKFPYVLIFFKKSDSELRVVAVAHISRRPGYWRRRE